MSFCFFKRLDSPLGKIILASDGDALTGLWFEEQKYCRAALEATAQEVETLPAFVQTEAWLKEYFSGKAPATDKLPLAPQGTPFRRMIWRMLGEIPYGETVTYGELARNAARVMGVSAMSAQAVGGAVGHNPIGIIIPCHRVVGVGGALTGYAGGIEKKIWLLRHEMGSEWKK